MKRLDHTRLVTGSRNKIQANFRFNEAWNGLEKFVVFKDEYNTPFRAYLGLTGCTFNCMVPCEVLRNGRFFTVSVYAGDRLTSNSVVIPLERGEYHPEPDKHHHKHSHGGCSKDVFVDIYERIHSCFDDVEFTENDELNFYNDGELYTTISLPYSHEEDVRAWMAEADLRFQNIESVLATKSDIGHKHVTEDVTDYEDNMDANLDSLLCTLARAINEIE